MQEAVDPAPNVLEEVSSLLPADEVERWSDIRTGAARASYLRSRLLLRRALALETGREPAQLRFDRRCEWCGDSVHGRPRLIGGGPEFSRARSGGLEVLATASEPVGIDVEEADGDLPLFGMDRILTPEEVAAARASSEQGWRLWTAKEAVGKARGSGLLGLADIRIDLAEADHWSEVTDGDRRWVVRADRVGPRHMVAVCVPVTPLRVDFSRFDESRDGTRSPLDVWSGAATISRSYD